MASGLSLFRRFGLSLPVSGAIPCNAVYYNGEVVYYEGQVVTFGTLTADTTGVSADSECGTADFEEV